MGLYYDTMQKIAQAHLNNRECSVQEADHEFNLKRINNLANCKTLAKKVWIDQILIDTPKDQVQHFAREVTTF